MCGRVSIKYSPEEVMDYFGLQDMPKFTTNDDGRPTNELPMVFLNANGGTECRLARWGLVPHDSPTRKPAKVWINARGETMHSVEPWATVWKKDMRCLIPVSSWFEWPKLAGIEKKMRISRVDDKPFAFAGLYSVWNETGDPHDDLYSFTIVTIEPSEEFMTYHNRQPVIVDRADIQAWLRPNKTEAKALVRAYPEGLLKYEPM